MDKIRLLVFLIIAFFASVFVQDIFNEKKQQDVKAVIIVPSATPTSRLTPTPQTHVLITSTPAPTTAQNQDLAMFVYPSSTRIRQEKDNLVLESLDNPKTITDWYKERITSLNMVAKSFVQTTTNGNVLNKLVGTNGLQEISIEISKTTVQSHVEIVVRLKFHL